MARPQLTLVSARALRPALGLPRRGALVAIAGAAAVLCLAYLAARETPLFALERVEISGAPPDVRMAVDEAVEPLLGDSLVALDGGELRSRLEALPSVRSVRYDRAFPHTLRLFVRPETPLAVLRNGPSAWLLSERGRAIEALAPQQLAGYPRIWTASEPDLAPGEIVQERATLRALRALAFVPKRFPVGIRAARVGAGGITLTLARGAELRLGGPASLRLKLAVAARVLESLSASERADLAYLDVTVPARPVAAAEPQLSG